MGPTYVGTRSVDPHRDIVSHQCTQMNLQMNLEDGKFEHNRIDIKVTGMMQLLMRIWQVMWMDLRILCIIKLNLKIRAKRREKEIGKTNM